MKKMRRFFKGNFSGFFYLHLYDERCLNFRIKNLLHASIIFYFLLMNVTLALYALSSFSHINALQTDTNNLERDIKNLETSSHQ